MKDTFGSRFKRARIQKGLTQDELRKEFNEKYFYNFTLPAISQYENDKRIPEIEALKAFADYFNVSLDWLLCRVDNPLCNVDNRGTIIANLKLLMGSMTTKEFVEYVNSPDITEEMIEYALSGKIVLSGGTLYALATALGVDYHFFYRKNTESDIDAAKRVYLANSYGLINTLSTDEMQLINMIRNNELDLKIVSKLLNILISQKNSK